MALLQSAFAVLLRSYKHLAPPEQSTAIIQPLPPAAAAASSLWRVTESWWSLRVCSVRTRNSLAGDHHVPFIQVTVDNFRCGTIAKSDRDPAALWFAILAQHPNDPSLARQHWS
jgi:hypothetical protein